MWIVFFHAAKLPETEALLNSEETDQEFKSAGLPNFEFSLTDKSSSLKNSYLHVSQSVNIKNKEQPKGWL